MLNENDVDNLLRKELANITGSSFCDHLPVIPCYSVFRLPIKPTIVLERAYWLLQSEGKVFATLEKEFSSCRVLSGVIGSGFWKLSPTLLHVETREVENGECLVNLSGYAKEGWIRDYSAMKAVARLEAILKSLARDILADRIQNENSEEKETR